MVSQWRTVVLSVRTKKGPCLSKMLEFSESEIHGCQFTFRQMVIGLITSGFPTNCSYENWGLMYTLSLLQHPGHAKLRPFDMEKKFSTSRLT